MRIDWGDWDLFLFWVWDWVWDWAWSSKRPRITIEPATTVNMVSVFFVVDVSFFSSLSVSIHCSGRSAAFGQVSPKRNRSEKKSECFISRFKNK